MKVSCGIFAMLLFTLIVNGQNTVNIWVSGNHGGIDFSGDTAVSFFRPDNDFIWRTSASICDSEGNLLFYTNGFRIYNRIFETMQNGDSLNIGDYINFNYATMPIPDGAVIIPNPTDTNKYYVLYMDLNFINTELGIGLYPSNLFYSVVDLSLDGGNGAIVNDKKDIVILSDTLAAFGMQVVRHGNGQDWWLICHEYGSNKFYKFLIDKTGIHGPYEQEIGIQYKLINAQIASIMKFNDDGTKFLHLTYDSNKVEVFDFDRCSGELYNYIYFKVDSDMAYCYGASFSPNGKYLYVSTDFEKIRQFDLESVDISASQKVIGTDDGIGDPFSARYYLHQLGIDRKIYVTSYDACYSIHVINDPDSAGLACNFVQRGFEMTIGSYWAATTPNIPNYSLASLQGSECDTLTEIAELPQPIFTFGVYPNPCYQSSQLSISGATQKAEIFLYNIFGQLLYQTISFPSNNFIHAHLPVRDLVAGIYLVKVSMGEKEIAQKLVKR